MPSTHVLFDEIFDEKKPSTKIARYILFGEGRSSLPDISKKKHAAAWEDAVRRLTLLSWGKMVIDRTNIAVPTLHSTPKIPYEIGLVPTLHPNFPQPWPVAEQMLELADSVLESPEDFAEHACRYGKNVKPLPVLRENVTWEDDAKVHLMMLDRVSRVCPHLNSFGIASNIGSWLFDLDGRKIPEMDMVKRWQKKVTATGADHHPRVSSREIPSLLQAVGVNPRIGYRELVDRYHSVEIRKGDVSGSNRLLCTLSFLASKAGKNWRWLAADCREGYNLSRSDDGRAEAWDLLALGVVMKSLGIREPKLVGLLETHFGRGIENLRDYMPSEVNWEPLAAFSDLGRRGSFFQSLLGIFINLYRRYIDRMYWGCGSSPYRGGIGLANLLRMAPRSLRSIRSTVQGGSIWEFLHPQAVATDFSVALSHENKRPSEASLNAIQEVCCNVGEAVWRPYLDFDLLSHDAFTWGQQALPTMGERPIWRPGLENEPAPLAAMRAISVAAMQETSEFPVTLIGGSAALLAASQALGQNARDFLPVRYSIQTIQQLLDRNWRVTSGFAKANGVEQKRRKAVVAMLKAAQAVAKTYDMRPEPSLYSRNVLGRKVVRRLTKLRLEAVSGMQSEQLLKTMNQLHFAAVGFAP
jgi:hypothetical protein